MTITRVIRDGVEFFTIDATGESGMSESGLARLCGVSQQAINKILRNIASTQSEDSALKAKLGGKVWLQPRGLSPIERTKITHLSIVNADACAAVVEHYAFESKYKTPEAIFAYRKFARSGINGWIQEMTEWHGNPTPRNGIVIDFTSLDTLLTTKFDASALRLYLYFQKAIRNRHTPTIEETLKATNISRSTYNTATAKLEPYQLLPEWSKVQRRNQPERAVRDRLQTQLGGQTEAPTPWGPVDLLTASEIIEVKALHLWKEAFGHLILKSKFFPNHTKRLHLYAPNNLNLKKVIEECQEFDIKVTFEETEKEETKPRNRAKNRPIAQPQTAISPTPT
jgi:transcriptional regulator with XRE-family HTH domain